jgi:hypothetical protein
MKTLTSMEIKMITVVIVVAMFAFFGLSFKASDSNGQVMTVMPLQSKSAMKGDRDLCLIVDGNIIERIELPSAFSSKIEDQVTAVTTINKTLNKLSRDGWKIVTGEGNVVYTLIK